MLFKILDNLRTKPKHVRDQFALGIAVFSTLAIGGLWSLSLPSRFAAESQVAALASSTNAAPFTNFFSQLKNQFGGMKAAIDEAKVSTSTTPSIASSTEDALNLQLSDENKASLETGTVTEQGTKIEFGTATQPTTTNNSYSNQVIVASSTGTTTQRR